MKVVTLKTQARSPQGKSGARRTRREGRLPAVVYGGKNAPEHVSLPTHDFQLALQRGARVLDLESDGADTTRVLLTDVQYDALGLHLVHADLFRVDPKKALELNVPVELTGVPKGVGQGGILTVQHKTVRISCLPRLIPEGLQVNISELELGQTLFARDVALPEKVDLASDEDMPIVTISIPRGIGKDEEEGEEGETPTDGAAPEGADGEGAGDASGEEEEEE